MQAAHRDDLPAVPRNILLGFPVRRRFPGEGDRVRGQVRRRHHDVDQHLLHVLHLADFLPFMHVILGMVILAVIWGTGPQGGLHQPKIRTARRAARAYWHMVDLLWIILFPSFM